MRDVRVLVVDDDRAIALLVQRALEEEGIHAGTAHSMAEAERELAEQDYDLAILDIVLPDGSGLDILRHLRARNRAVLVLLLTVRRRESEVVEALDAGADDHLGKPFSIAELKARVRALLRRRGDGSLTPLEFQGVRVERASHGVRVNGEPVTLTPREFDLLEYLLRRPNRVVPREELLESVWRMDFDPGTNVIDVHVSHLRRKLNRHRAAVRIRTERGVGFAVGPAPGQATRG